MPNDTVSFASTPHRQTDEYISGCKVVGVWSRLLIYF